MRELLSWRSSWDRYRREVLRRYQQEIDLGQTASREERASRSRLTGRMQKVTAGRSPREGKRKRYNPLLSKNETSEEMNGRGREGREGREGRNEGVGRDVSGRSRTRGINNAHISASQPSSLFPF